MKNFEPNARPPVAEPRMRVLFIHPGPVPPSARPERNAYHFLSQFMGGVLVTTTWLIGDSEAAQLQRQTEVAMGRLGLEAAAFGLAPRFRGVRSFLFYLRTGYRLSKQQRFDVIVSYGIYSTGLAALILSKIVGRPFVIDVPGHPFRGIQLQGTRTAIIKARVARWIAPRILNRARAIKLLYPTQLDDLEVTSRAIRRVFHEFTPVTNVKPLAGDDQYILFLGYPWYLKGVDILIRAFLQIADDFPSVRLLIVGHCPDRTPFERLAGGHPRIEFRKAVPHEEAEKLLARCSFLAVPSRTEAMGRVILEAYAARKTVVASRVDGIPTVVKDEQTGLLVEPGNVEDLARQLRRLLEEPTLAGELAANGFSAVHSQYSELCYAAAYSELLEETVRVASSERRAAGIAERV